MFKKGNKLNRLSVEELEQILKIKQRDARRERFLRLSAEGAPPDAALLRAQDSAALPTGATPSTASNAGLMQTPQLYPLKGHTAAPRPKPKDWRDRVLALVEVGALAGLVAVLIVSYLNLQTLNQEVVATRLQNRFIPASPGEPAFSPP
ncbi:MAG: hypothetical protein ACE5G8_10880, partial [Anaerolineae bacterium]